MHKPTKLKKLLIAGLVLALALVVSEVLAEERTEQGLIACWHFDEGVGSRCDDASGNSNHGRRMGASWVDGKHGKALRFERYAVRRTSEAS